MNYPLNDCPVQKHNGKNSMIDVFEIISRGLIEIGNLQIDFNAQDTLINNYYIYIQSHNPFYIIYFYPIFLRDTNILKYIYSLHYALDIIIHNNLICMQTFKK